MIEFDFIERLIRALDESSVDTIEIERGGTRVRLSKTPSTAVAVATPAPSLAAPPVAAPVAASSPTEQAPPAPAEGAVSSSRLVDVTSPMVGTFYRSPAPDAPPYVDVGARVGVGSVGTVGRG